MSAPQVKRVPQGGGSKCGQPPSFLLSVRHSRAGRNPVNKTTPYKECRLLDSCLRGNDGEKFNPTLIHTRGKGAAKADLTLPQENDTSMNLTWIMAPAYILVWFCIL